MPPTLFLALPRRRRTLLGRHFTLAGRRCSCSFALKAMLADPLVKVVERVVRGRWEGREVVVAAPLRVVREGGREGGRQENRETGRHNER